MADPLQQFSIQKIGPVVDVAGLEFSLTNQALWMLISVSFIALFFAFGMRKKEVVPGRLQSAVEMTFEFIQSLAKDTCGPEALRYTPVIFSLFLFVCVMNVFGMIPGSFTSTSQIVITGFLAVAVFLSVIIIGFMKHGFKFLTLFIPHGAPALLVPVIAVLEVISFFIRPFTLAVRLGANMMAGHIALKVFAGFVVAMLTAGGAMAVGSIIPFLGLFALTALELFVAFLQAYIFTLLACVYLNDAINLH